MRKSRDSTRDGWMKQSILNENEVLGCYGQSGMQRKKTANRHKYATFLGGFFNFLWAKRNSFKKNIYFSICTEKLHSMKAKKILKMFGNYFMLG